MPSHSTTMSEDLLRVSGARPVDVATAPTAPRKDAAWRHTFAALQNRDFSRLWLASLLVVGGFQMQAIAQGYLVYQLTGSAKILGLIGAATAVPILLLSPLGGTVADRLPRKRIVQVGQGIMALSGLLIAVAIITDTLIWQHLLIMAALQGTIWSFSGPARQALLPQLVPRERLGNAVALLSAGMSAPMLIAPMIAGAIYALVGPEAVYLTQGVLALAAAGLTTSIGEMGRPAEGPRARVVADIAEGLLHIWRDSTLRMLLATVAVVMLLSAPLHMMLPVLVVDVYHMDVGALGLLVSASGIGAVSGALMIAAMRSGRRGALMIVGAVVSGAALVVIALAPFYLLAVAAMVLVGLGGAGLWSLGQVLIMDRVDDRHRARVMSVNMMVFGFMPFAIMPAALAADVLGAPLVIGVLGAGLLTVSLVLAATRSPLLRLP